MCAVEAGVCFVPACGEDGDCALGKVCVGGRCETDTGADRDRDGVPDAEDGCPEVADTDQGDLDQDGLGDACDADDDNDGRVDALDNCPRVANPGQVDANGDGVGNACDADTPATTVVGRVDGSSSPGAAVDEARVYVAGRQEPAVPDPQGAFVFEQLLPEGGAFVVRVVWAGFVPFERTFVAPSDVATWDMGTLVMQAERQSESLGVLLTGLAQLEGGSAHDGIVVRVREGGALVATTLTDAEGRYTVRASRVPQSLDFAKEGYLDGSLEVVWDGVGEQFTVDGVPLGETAAVVLRPDRSATLSGRLTSSLGVSDWTARVRSGRLIGQGVEVPLVVQADGGMALADAVVPGTWTLRIDARGHLPLTQTVVLERGEQELGAIELTPKFVELAGRARLSGQAVHVGILVRVLFQGSVLDTTTTGDNGDFASRTIEDDLTLELSAPGYVSDAFEVTWDEALGRFAVLGEALATSEALVLQPNLNATLRGQLTTELPGYDWGVVEVRLAGTDERLVGVDGVGGFVETGLRQGLVVLTVDAPGHEPVERVVSLVEGTTDLELIALRTLPVRMAGEVRLSGETDHAGVAVRLRRDGVLIDSTLTDRTGAFAFQTVPLAAQLGLSAPGFLDRAVNLVWDGEGFAVDGAPLEGTPLVMVPQPQGDRDGDGVPDAIDNCRLTSNPDQANLDAAMEGGAAVGDVCDADVDGDGVPNGLDNCPRAYNPMQEDPWRSGQGIACAGADIDRPFAVGDGVLRQHLDTRGRADRLSGSCGGRGAPEVVYEVPLAAGETVTAVVEARHNVAVYLLDALGQELDCQTRTRFEHQVVVSGTYMLVVDGFSEVSAGPVRVDIPRPVPWGVSQVLPARADRLDAASQPYRVWSGDLDRDGQAEVVVTFTHLFNQFQNTGEVGIYHVTPEEGPVLTQLLNLDPWTTNARGFDADGDGWTDLGVTMSATFTRGDSRFQVVLNQNGVMVPGPWLTVGADLTGFYDGAYNVVRPDGAFFEDLNEDGFMDVVVLGEFVRVTQSDAEGLRYVAYVLLGHGDGQFTQVPERIDFPRTVLGLWLGDIDGDGHVDMAASTYLDSTVWLGHGRGDGTFEVSPSLPVAYGPVGVWGEDLEGDGATDLITANLLSQDATLFKGLGHNAFLESSLPMPGSHERLTNADVNGDGVLDLVLGARFEDAVGVAQGLGDGTFVPSQLLGLPTPTGESSAAVDLNGDGAGDILTTHILSRELSTIFGALPAHFATTSTLSADPTFENSGPSHLLARDLDGDGEVELIVSNRYANSLSVFIRGAAGWERTTISLRKDDPSQQVTNPANLVVAELTGDGVLDLAVLHPTSDRVSLVPGLDGGGSGPSQVLDFFPRGQQPGGLVAVDLATWSPNAVTPGADGWLDLLVTTGGERQALLVNGGPDNGFVACRDSMNGSCPPLAPFVGLTIFGAEVADMNGDGRADLIALEEYPEPSVHLYDTGDPNDPDIVPHALLKITNADQPPVDPPPLGGCVLPIVVRVADLDGGGAPDLILACRGRGAQTSVPIVVLMNTSADPMTLTFAPAIDIVDVPGALTFEVADVTDDGLLDLIVAQDNRDAVAILAGDGTGHFTAHQTLSIPGSVLSTVAADLDGDGLPEIVMPGQETGKLHIASRVGPASPFVAGSRLTDAALPACAAMDVEGVVVDEGAVRFQPLVTPAGPLAPCRIDRLELTVESFEGADLGSWVTLEGEALPVTGRRMALWSGSTPLSGRLRPEEVGGLARFEGSPARGTWWLRATVGDCHNARQVGPGCVSASVFAGATLHVNGRPADPLAPVEVPEGSPAAVAVANCGVVDPVCVAPGCTFGDLCRWSVDEALSGQWDGVADEDLVLVEGPGVGGPVYGGQVYGGWQEGQELTITLTMTAGLGTPRMALELLGSGVELAVAEPGAAGVWELRWTVPAALRGRYLAVRLTPPPGIAGRVAYSVALSVQ